MSETLPMSLVDLFILAERRPERLRQRLGESPPTAERLNIELALAGAESVRWSSIRMEYLLACPRRWRAAMLFWASVADPPRGRAH